MTHTSEENKKEFLALARKRLAECGNSHRIAMYSGYETTNACTGCPGYGIFGGEYESCIYDAALDVGEQ